MTTATFRGQIPHNCIVSQIFVLQTNRGLFWGGSFGVGVLAVVWTAATPPLPPPGGKALQPTRSEKRTSQ